MILETPRLKLILETREQVLARVANMPAELRKELSPVWLANVEAGIMPARWLYGFSLVLKETGIEVGTGGFKGPPVNGVVELAYGIEDRYQNRGYATEAAAALTADALAQPEVAAVIAHTLPGNGPSQNVLTKCGFMNLGEVIDPEDGLVLRWEKKKGIRAQVNGGE